MHGLVLIGKDNIFEQEQGMALKPVIHPSLLIEEVKKRSCLYDNKGVHGNYELKNAAWGEIASAIFDEKWNEFSLQEKDLLVRELQTKWKSLRDNFSRQLRVTEQAKAGLGTMPTRKYVYMDQMSFLTPFINKRDKYVASNDESKDSSDSMFLMEDHKPFSNISLGDSMDASNSQTQMHFVPIQPKPTFTATTITPIDINTITNNPSNPLLDQSEPVLKKVAKCLDELVTLQKEEKAEDTMGNKRFLLSLLPFMKKLPDDVNLEVRLQLMSVLQTYTSGKGFSN